jgi:cysteine desulfurase
MLANTEMGTIQPIREIAAFAKERGILFHADAVQAIGNISVDTEALGVDLLSLSAHKIYGPKGAGALYIRKGTTISNLMFGGGQESKKRAGTENLPGIVGFGKAAELAESILPEHSRRLTDLRNYFIQETTRKINGVRLNGDPDRRLPGNVNLTFEGLEGEAILLLLDLKGIEVSAGSACSSSSFAPSHVLLAMGIPIEQVYSSLRFTIGDFTTRDDLDYVVEVLAGIVSKLSGLS